MRKKESQKLGEIIREYVRAMDIDGKLKEVGLVKSWEEVIGRTVAKATNDIYIKNRKLFVYLNSSVIRNQLLMMKQGILDALNKKAGEKVIDDIKVEIERSRFERGI